MKKVLIITYDFPPFGGGNVMRMLKLAKYLPEYNWLPIILTTKQYQSVQDFSLLKELNPHIKIYRTKGVTFTPFQNKVKSFFETQDTKKIFYRSIKSALLKLITKINNLFEKVYLIPDRKILWKKNAIKLAKKIILEQKIDSIITTSPPNSTHFIGQYLNKKFNIPWLADFRDGWTYWPLWQPITFLHRKIEYKMEKKVLNNADYITTATNLITKNFRDRFSELKKIDTITNGFDPEDFKFSQIQNSNSIFTIIYTGTMDKTQTLRPFCKALRELISENKIKMDRIRIDIYGRLATSEIQEAFNRNLQNVMHFHGHKDHHTVCKLLTKSDIALLIIYDKPGSEAIYTTKLFDYIGARLPILAIVPKGIAHDLIISEHLGVAIRPTDIITIKKSILYFYKKFYDGEVMINQNHNLLKKFNRKLLTEKLAKILNQISTIPNAK